MIKYIVSTMIVALITLNIATAQANPYIKFTATEVSMVSGVKTTIKGYFYNSGDMGATVNRVYLNVRITDNYGNYIWSDDATFYDVDIYVSSGSTRYHTFNITNQNCPGYNGAFKWNVDNRIWWNW